MLRNIALISLVSIGGVYAFKNRAKIQHSLSGYTKSQSEINNKLSLKLSKNEKNIIQQEIERYTNIAKDGIELNQYQKCITDSFTKIDLSSPKARKAIKNCKIKYRSKK